METHDKETSQTSNRSPCHGAVTTGNRLRYAALDGPFLKRLKFESARGICIIVKTKRKNISLAERSIKNAEMCSCDAVL